ncbi:putative glycolipid-binding domain-containing protein [Planococcus sp. YIM B11945]|uniref:putative glycolipid-binding domain-containing protein n=1 Tax=Planococcus sp. YIM B11945 TaxID=3435410 RepID=UPI003D7D6007
MVSSEMVWENKDTFGCEYLKFTVAEHSFFAESTGIYLEPNYPIQINYQIALDRAWRTKSVAIQNRSGNKLQLTSTGTGNWFDEHGNQLDKLTGSIDVDLSATPFSNTFPINRSDWKTGQTREFDMAYIFVPLLEVQKMKQTYTFIETKGKNKVSKFQSPGFESLILVDENGFVVEYPQLFSRRY